MSEELIVLNDLSRIEELKQYIRDNEFIAYDTETTGTDKESSIIGFSFSAHIDKAYYVVLSYWDKHKEQLIDLPTRNVAKDIIQELVGKSLIMHNAVFDCFMTVNNFGIELMPYVHTDTMLLAHLTDENRQVGLKELGTSIFGEDSKKEQTEMKASVTSNGGMLTKDKYELYKADPLILGKYGAKDTILTIKLFYHLGEDLINQGLDKFFYEDESMPLLRTATYDLNTTGLRIDPEKLQKLKGELEVQCMEAKAFIYNEITPIVKHKYPGTKDSNTFNINGGQQLSWLLFEVLGNEFHTLTKGGRDLCKSLGIKPPYAPKDKREFIRVCKEYKDKVYEEGAWNPKTKKMGRPKKVGDYWKYIAVGKDTCLKLSKKYKWVASLLEYKKNEKLLNTYVEGIQSRMKYNVIRPSFLQHGTTSGRYSSKNPNFQNLPRKDKRIKSVVVSRPGKVFVGADYSQLEPRVFASFSGDKRLQASFTSGDDFYSVIGMEVFDKYDCTPQKEGSDQAFGVKYPNLRDIAKVITLSATYGTTAFKMAPTIGKNTQEAQEVIDEYFEKFPSVHAMMLESHEMAKEHGEVVNLFGRPRRMPRAKTFRQVYGNTPHAEMPYEARNLLNLAVNHRIQSTGASIMNRAAIAFKLACYELAKEDNRWLDVKIVMQVHDELIVEAPEALGQDVVIILKDAMENTTILPGVQLEAIPKIAKNLSDLK